MNTPSRRDQRTRAAMRVLRALDHPPGIAHAPEVSFCATSASVFRIVRSRHSGRGARTENGVKLKRQNISVSFLRASDPELVIRTPRLTLRPATQVDAEDCFELIAHPDLPFVSARPSSVEDMRASIQHGRVPGESEDLIHHEWTVRRNDDNALVAFASCNMMRRVDLQTVDGKATEVELRVIEPTIYVHPAHQRNGYGPETVGAIEDFGHRYYGATESRPKIDPGNAASREMARKRGAKRLLPATIYDPLETWTRRLP
jgi:RimJ/RimL family protein N-acetyltransferase